MPRHDLQKHTMNFRAGDVDFLASVYRNRQISASEVIRELVANAVDRLREKIKTETVDLKDLPDE